MRFYQTYKQLLPLSIWLLFSLLAVARAVIGETYGNVTTHLELNPRHYIGFIFLATTIAAFFFLRKYYRYFVLLTVLLGVFNLAWFSGSNFQITFGAKLQLTIQPLSVLVGLWFFVINFGMINAFLGRYRDDEQPATDFSEEEKLKFREKFAAYSDPELNTIRSNSKYRPEARRAAEELLSEHVAERMK